RAEAGAADDEPSVEAEGVVDREAGLRVGDRGDVGDAALVAQPVLLPSRLVDVRGAAARRSGPGRLRPPPLAAVAHQGGAAHGGDELGRARIADAAGEDQAVAVAVIAGRDRDGDAAVLVVALEVLLAGKLAAAPIAVRDRVGPQRDRRIDRRPEV